MKSIHSEIQSRSAPQSPATTEDRSSHSRLPIDQDMEIHQDSSFIKKRNQPEDSEKSLSKRSNISIGKNSLETPINKIPSDSISLKKNSSTIAQNPPQEQSPAPLPHSLATNDATMAALPLTPQDIGLLYPFPHCIPQCQFPPIPSNFKPRQSPAQLSFFMSQENSQGIGHVPYSFEQDNGES